MDVQFGPNSQDEPNLLYKLQHKLLVFNTTDSLSNRGYNLISSSSKYGLVFVASPDGTLSVYYLKELIDKENSGAHHLSIKVPGKPTHIAINCDQELLAVTEGQSLLIYKVSDFVNSNVSPCMNIRCDVNPSSFVSSLQWNPCIPDSIAIAYFDGTLLVSQVSTGQIKKIQAKARCLCWSPKGKQLVTGNSDGTLMQFKPDLTPAKTIPAPNLFEGAPIEALAIHWISTFQFAVVFKNSADNSRPSVTIVNTPKAGQPVCINYEDICYSMGSNRPWYYYLHGMAQWNIILTSSSNSMEIATLGTADGANWLQWCQTDEGRPELPLTNKTIENYPVGICIDTAAIHQLPWGENETLPPMPLLLVLSQSGLLTIYNIINLKKDAPQICSPPQAITLPANAMISDIPGEAPAVVQPTQPQVQQQPPPAYQPQVQLQLQPQPVQLQPQPVQLQPQPVQLQPQPVQLQPQPVQLQQQPVQHAPTSQFGALNFDKQPISQAQQPPAQVKPILTPQPQIAQATPKASLPETKPQSPLSQENAALKEEQEKISKMKANQELKSMLLQEVNEFQMDAYRFAVKTRQVQIQLQKDINAMCTTFDLHSLDVDNLRKQCCLDELRARIVQLKLELVRACAVVAETRTHAEMKDIHEWMHADPLTTKRIASIKKIAYYVQTQLENAQRALDHRWSDLDNSNLKYKRGHMIRPILDDIYQPLVKQQEILSRQSAVLRTLKSALNECNSSPIAKLTSMLRSTPFKNKDPLSKLTKNILNMSIESKNDKCDGGVTAQKLDALRDMLANNKIVKIKPVNIEISERMKAVRISYEKILREKEIIAQKEAEEEAKKEAEEKAKIEAENEAKSRSVTGSKLSVSPIVKQSIPGLTSVAKTLYTDDVPVIQLSSQPIPKSLFTSKLIPESVQPFEPQKTIPSFEPKPSTQVPKTSEPPKPVVSVPKPIVEAPLTSGPPKPTFAVGLKTVEPTKPIASFEVQAANDDPKSTLTQAPEKVKSSLSFGAQITEPSKPVHVFGSQTDSQNPLSFGTQTSQPIKPSFGSQTAEPPKLTTTSTPTINTQTRSVLKDMLQSKSMLNADANKKDENSFMGQKISSPSAFNFSAATPTMTSTPLITAKPIAEISNMFSKFSTPSVESKPNKPQSDETGEVETSVTITIPAAKSDNKVTATPLPNIVPDVLKSTQDIVKPKEEKSESKENIPEKSKPVLKPSSKANVTKVDDGSKTPILSPITQLTNSNVTPVKPEAKVASEKTDVKTTVSSVFASAVSNAQSIFGSSSSLPKSIFSNAAQSNTAPKLFESPTSPGGSIFSPTSTPSTFTSSIFGVKATTSESKPTDTTLETTSASNILETSKTTSSVETKSIFSTATDPKATTESKPSTPEIVDKKSEVESKPSTPVESKPLVFSTPTPASPSVFGNQSPLSKPSSAASIFASANTQSFANTTATVTQSVFGSAEVTTTSAFSTLADKPAFVSTPLFTTTAQSTFGAATVTTQASIFGGSSATTQPSSVFAAAVTTTPGSIFSAATTTTQSIFGATSSPTQSIFGTAPSTQSSVFGGSGGSVFGATTPPTTQSSLFGTPTTQASMFGQSSPTSGSIFGTQPTTTASTGSVFGATENLFASASISTTSAPSQSGGSIFGGGSGTSTFANNTNVFGKTTFGASNPSAASIFGGASTFGQKPPENTNFWGSGNVGSTGGFGSTGFGQTATTQSSSIFGSGGSFSSPSPSGGAFSSTAPAGTVFGSPQQQKAPAFGGSFGAKPAFGQPAGFGSPPAAGGFGSGASFGGFSKSPGGGFGAPAAFGGGATFGSSAFGGSSPGKVFGGASPTPGFGSTQSNATFENLATQNTLTFGNLAQTAPAPAAPPAFNTSPSFTGWRG